MKPYAWMSYFDIETRIGELAANEEKAIHRAPMGGTDKPGSFRQSGKPLKHERLGMTAKRMQQSQLIAKHPKIVERVKLNARAAVMLTY